MACWHGARKGCACGGAAIDQGQVVDPFGGGACETVAINGGVRGRGMGPRGLHVCCQNTARAIFEGDFLGGHDAGQLLAQMVQRIINRRPVGALRHGKAIVLKRGWHDR